MSNYQARYVNANRSNEQRRARYCFLTNGIGLNRNMARAIVGRSDPKIDQTLLNLNMEKVKEEMKLMEIMKDVKKLFRNKCNRK